MIHNQKCFKSHMGAWAVAISWLTEAVAAVRAGTMPVVKEDGFEDRQKEWDAYIKSQGASKVVRGQDSCVEYAVFDGVAVVGIDGPMQKFDSKYGGCNTIRTRQAIRDAANDGDVQSILLHIDSPGGSVAGTMELADDVAAANEKKPVNAYASDMCCSAAYWVASQARRIFANEMAMVGSIGTFAVVYDESKAAEMQGVKVHVVSSGPMKGQGQPGAPITPEYLGEIQSLVDDFNVRFLKAVGAGREMDKGKVEDIATGQVWIAQKAKQIGLIDQVASFDEVLSSLASPAVARSTGRRAKAAVEIDLDMDS